MNSPPPSWTPALGELVLKVDSKFKVRKIYIGCCGVLTCSSRDLAPSQKIISALLKDLDVFARNSIKDELASLDPLLRNVGGWGGGGPVGTGDEAGRALDDYDQ